MLEEDTILDKKTFQALSSDTRINILKDIKNGRKTVSEISRELDINKSAVLKHLTKMIQAGLVTRFESDNQFVYYGITRKGGQILKSEIKVKIILSLSILSFSIGAIQIYRYVNKLLLPPELQIRARVAELYVGFALIFISIILFYYSRRIKN